MKKDIYTYPAIFNYAEDGISIIFPDLPGCLPCASYVRKNVTLPHWLERLAESKGINFSQILQKSLKDILGIGEYKHS